MLIKTGKLNASAQQQSNLSEEESKMKKVLAMIDLFRPKNARATLAHGDERKRINVEQQYDKLRETSKAQIETIE